MGRCSAIVVVSTGSKCPSNSTTTAPNELVLSATSTSRYKEVCNTIYHFYTNLLEGDLLTLQNYLRGSLYYNFQQALTDIGHRDPQEKFFAELSQPTKGKGASHDVVIMMKFAPLGDFLSSKFFTFVLGKLNHPFLAVPSQLEVLPEPRLKVIVIRPLFRNGSLRDFIHKCSPEQPSSQKYSKEGVPLSLEEISLFGCQILEALLFLQQIRFPFPHLHCGNILVQDDTKRIL